MDVVIAGRSDAPPEEPVVIPYSEDTYQQILRCWGYPLLAPPLADLLRALHHLTGSWLIVSPIYWEASHKDVTLSATGKDLALSEAAGQACFAAFAEFAAQEGATCYYHNPVTWLLQLDNRPPITACPVDLLRHRSLQAQLAGLDTTLFWQRFLTEAQMFFKQQEFKLPSAYPINGIWVWGAGQLHPLSQRLIVVDSNANQSIAQLLSDNVQWLSEQNSYPSDSVFLLENPAHYQGLALRLRDSAVHWYWQNDAYQTKPRTWLQKLGSLLCW